MCLLLMFMRENIPKDKKSVAINVTLQAFDKTLTENDLDELVKRLMRQKLVLTDPNDRYKKNRNFSIIAQLITENHNSR